MAASKPKLRRLVGELRPLLRKSYIAGSFRKVLPLVQKPQTIQALAKHLPQAVNLQSRLEKLNLDDIQTPLDTQALAEPYDTNTTAKRQKTANLKDEQQDNPFLRKVQAEASQMPPSPLPPSPALSPPSIPVAPQSTLNEHPLRMKERVDQPRWASTAAIIAELARLVEAKKAMTDVVLSQPPLNHKKRPRTEEDSPVDDSDPLSETGLNDGGLSGHDAGLDERNGGESVVVRDGDHADRQPHPNRKKRRFNNEESMPSVLLDTEEPSVVLDTEEPSVVLDTEETAPDSQATSDSTAHGGRRTKSTVAKAAPRAIGKSRKGPPKRNEPIPVLKHFLFVPDDDDDNETTGVLRPAAELPAKALSSIQNAYQGLLDSRRKQVQPSTMLAERNSNSYVDRGICIARFITQGAKAKACESSVACKTCTGAGRPCIRLETRSSEENTIAVFYARPVALRGNASWKDEQFWLHT